MAKDFTGIQANKVKSTIEEATKEEPKKRKPRKTYTKREMYDFMEEMQTAGRKGVKLPRINLAFTPENFEYIKAMSRAAGLSQTEFINRVISAHKEEYLETYEQVLEFRKLF